MLHQPPPSVTSSTARHREITERPLFWVLQNNLLQAMAEQEEQLDVTTCDSSVHRLRYRTGQAGVKGPCSSQTLLRRALSLLIKEGSVSSAPPQLWLQGFMLCLSMYTPTLASSRRTKDWLSSLVSHFASCLSSEIPSRVMWPVHSSSEEISKGTLKSVLKRLIRNWPNYTSVSRDQSLWKREKPYTW